MDLNSKTNNMKENENITVTDKTLNVSTFLKVIEEISPIPKTLSDTNSRKKNLHRRQLS